MSTATLEKIGGGGGAGKNGNRNGDGGRDFKICEFCGKQDARPNCKNEATAIRKCGYTPAA